MNHPNALETILHSPRLPEYAAIIQQRLAEESAKRERFYAEMSDEMSDEFKMEFIDGEVIIHSPARNWHLTATKHILILLNTWVERNHLGLVQSEKALCIFQRNDYEPDVVFWGSEKAALIEPNTLKFPIPDLAVEVLSESTAARDHGVKFEDYAAHAVREYWIVDPEKESVEQYVLNSNGEYGLVSKEASSILTSVVVRGFSIPVRAIFDGDANHEALVGLLKTEL